MFQDSSQQVRSTVSTCIVLNIWKAFDDLDTKTTGVLRCLSNDLCLTVLGITTVMLHYAAGARNSIM